MGNYKKYGNVMIDLETLSTHTNASIIEIGAVEFNKITGETGESIDIFIKPQEWGMHERHIDGNTIKWWLSQSDEARKRFYEVDTDKIVVGLSESLVILSAFIRSCDNTDENEEGNVVVWGNSATMDITILETAFEYLKMTVPWKYWAVNDVRTIVDLKPDVKKNYKFEGTKHSSVDDCKHQIGYLSETLRTVLNVKEKKEKQPRYVSLLIPNEEFEVDCTEFPIDKFKSDEYKNRTCLTIDLFEKKLLGSEGVFDTDFIFFMKIVDAGIYKLYDEEFNEMGIIDGYAPNNVIPPTDGYGDYIEFNIHPDGTVDWYDYDKIHFGAFFEEND